MQKYKALAPITFRAGRFRLEGEALERRRFVTRPVAELDGVFEPIHEISFKAGDTIETDIEVPKALHAKLEPLEGPAADESSETGGGDAAGGDAPESSETGGGDAAGGDAPKGGRRGRRSARD